MSTSSCSRSFMCYSRLD